MASLARLDRCSVCHKIGGNHCMSCMSEDRKAGHWLEMPGCWSFFRDSEIIKLLADACEELDRRGSRLKIQVTA